MKGIKHTFSILITTKNRLPDLLFTLNSLSSLLGRNDVECVVYDDGSTDGAYQKIKTDFPKIKLFRNEQSKGLIYCRNYMLNNTQSDYAISLDDDAHFLTENPLEAIENYFLQNPSCGLLAFRIYWGLQAPIKITTDNLPHRVKGFVGCGHVWRMTAWRAIPNYPEWFVFYGEEEFAGYQLFKQKIAIHYLPEVLVHHRVDVKSRKTQSDYRLRLRRSFRSGWYLYFMFVPIAVIPKKLLYTLWIQLKTKTFKGDVLATVGIIQALFDVFVNLPKLLKESNRLTKQEYLQFQKLEPTKIYWKTTDSKN